MGAVIEHNRRGRGVERVALECQEALFTRVRGRAIRHSYPFPLGEPLILSSTAARHRTRLLAMHCHRIQAIFSMRASGFIGSFTTLTSARCKPVRWTLHRSLSYSRPQLMPDIREKVAKALEEALRCSHA